jgi:DNA-binding CsgD family transcriptional regulator
MATSVPDGLLERDFELRRLRALVRRALHGRGSVAVVEGAAGIGKTRLLEQISAEATKRGLRVLTARSSDLERLFPFGVVRQLFEPFVQGLGDGESFLGGFAAQAEPVFGPTDLDGELPDRSAAVVHGLYWLTCNLSEESPLMIAVDDAHWADEPSLLFLHYLSRRLDPLPVVLLLDVRRTASGPEADLVRRIGTARSGTVLELRPLTADATAKLVRSRLSAGVTDELCGACFTATGGNPFLVHELASVLVVEGVPSDSDAASRVGRLVPTAVERHVLVRLSRLSPTCTRVARAVAVLGEGVGVGVVAALTGLGEIETADAVDALVSAEILAPGLPLSFLHPLLREAVYADGRPGEQALAHARAARVFADRGAPPERTALQLLVSESAGSDWVVATLRDAGREATARGAPQSAARYLERALAEPPAESTRRDVLLELGVAESRSMQPGAAGHLVEALRLSVEPVARAQVAQELTVLYNLQGRFLESATVLEEAIDALGDSDSRLRYSLEAEAAVLAVTSLTARRRLASRLECFRVRAPSLLAEPEAAPLLAVIAEDLAETDGTVDEVLTSADSAFADGRLLSRDGAVPGIGAAALVLADKPARAERIMDAAIDDARARGSNPALRIHLVCRALARLRRGRVAEADADARLSIELSPNGSSDPVRPLQAAWLGEALLEQGRLEEAERLVALAEPALEDGDSMLLQPLADIRARLLVHRGRLAEAHQSLAEQLRWQQAWGCRNPGWTTTRSLAALVSDKLGRRDEACRLAAEDLAAARAFGAPRVIGIALRRLALVAAAPPIETLTESAEVLEGSEARLELARTLVELGSGLRRSGARRAACEPLHRGLEHADECGASLLVDRARSELLAAGARPRRPRVMGRQSLTPSEERVAAMAGDGLSNRQIAQALFLSPKTVEMHLGNIYRKLGIHSRRELPEALTGAEV